MEALRQVQDGTILDLEVSPGKDRIMIQGYNPWRKRIEISLSERAEKGKANDQLVSFFSHLFKLPAKNIRIVTGLSSRKKSVKIVGAKQEDILKILRNEL